MFKIRKIIVPTDFSRLSYSAFRYARDIGIEYSSEIHLVYTLEKIPPFLAMRSFDVSEDRVMESMREEALKSLAEAAEMLKGDSGLTVKTVLRQGLDYEEIIEYSEEIKADLIVLATHGRTGILHTLLGSVAEKIIRYAKCPVLVITPTQKDV